MAFIEVMATDRSGGLFASKAAMRRAITADVKSVRLRSVSPMGGSFSGTADEVPAGTTLVVVGPNPFNNRKWYGNIKLVNGKVKVS